MTSRTRFLHQCILKQKTMEIWILPSSNSSFRTWFCQPTYPLLGYLLWCWRHLSFPCLATDQWPGQPEGHIWHVTRTYKKLAWLMFPNICFFWKWLNQPAMPNLLVSPSKWHQQKKTTHAISYHLEERIGFNTREAEADNTMQSSQ